MFRVAPSSMYPCPPHRLQQRDDSIRPKTFAQAQADHHACWSRCACSILSQLLPAKINCGTAWFITLIRTDCIVDVGSPPDISSIRRRLVWGLRGFDYFGIVEPAYYAHITQGATPHAHSKSVCWHLHAVVWGINQRQVKALCDNLRQTAQYNAMTIGQDAALAKPVYDFPKLVGYMAKPPSHSYSIGLAQALAGGFVPRQYRTARLRAGDQVRLFLHMRDVLLPDLWTGGGEGRILNARIKRLADVRLRRNLRSRVSD